MKLKFVQFVHCHHVDIVLDIVFVVEIPCHVKHHAAPRTFGSIFYADTWCAPVNAFYGLVAVYLCREKLQQCLYSIKQTALVGAGDGYASRSHIQRVAFGLCDFCRVHKQHYFALA